MIRRVALIVLVLVVAGAAAGCAGPAGDPVDPAVIVFAYPEYMTAFSKASYERLAEAFNAENPDLRVELREISTETLMDRGAGYLDVVFDPEIGADVLLSPAFRSLAGDARLLDLEPLLDAHTEVDVDDFYPLALQQVRREGHLRGLPAELDLAVLYYNRDLFDRAGVPYPAAGWTRDDFLQAAVALRAGLPERMLAFAGQVDDAVPFIYTHGGRLPDSGPAALTDRLTVDAVRWFADLALVHGVMPLPDQIRAYRPEVNEGVTISSVTAGGEGAPAAELVWSALGAGVEMAGQEGDAALWSGRLSDRGGTGGWNWDFRWGVAPWPRDRAEIVIASTFAYFVRAGTPDPGAALRWVDYLTRRLPQLDGLPARRSVATSAEVRRQFEAEIGAEMYNACLATVEDGSPADLALYAGAERYLGQAMLDILEKGEDVGAALGRAH